MAARLTSSKYDTMNASAASCRAVSALSWNLTVKSLLSSRLLHISRTKRRNGATLSSKSVDFWYLRISLRTATKAQALCSRRAKNLKELRLPQSHRAPANPALLLGHRCNSRVLQEQTSRKKKLHNISKVDREISHKSASPCSAGPHMRKNSPGSS